VSWDLPKILLIGLFRLAKEQQDDPNPTAASLVGAMHKWESFESRIKEACVRASIPNNSTAFVWT